MSDRAAFQAVFSELKQVKTRGVVQIVLEAPIERGREILDILGGFPLPGEERWVACAAMGTSEPALKPVPHGPEAYGLCSNAAFQRWFLNEIGYVGPVGDANSLKELVVAKLKDELSIRSFTELDGNMAALDQFQTIQRAFRREIGMTR